MGADPNPVKTWKHSQSQNEVAQESRHPILGKGMFMIKMQEMIAYRMTLHL
jgi:hypothetical protein